MATIDTKICKYIRPESEANPDAEAWEFFLVWINPNGSICSWLFEDFETRQRIRGEVINTKSSNISKLYSNANQSIKLVAEDLTENEFDVISNITRAKVVLRYYKDSSFENIAILTDDIIKPKSQFRYNLQLEIELIEKNILV